jgi:hypothetical protein
VQIDAQNPRGAPREAWQFRCEVKYAGTDDQSRWRQDQRAAKIRFDVAQWLFRRHRRGEVQSASLFAGAVTKAALALQNSFSRKQEHEVVRRCGGF